MKTWQFKITKLTEIEDHNAHVEIRIVAEAWSHTMVDDSDPPLPRVGELFWLTDEVDATLGIRDV